MWIISGSYANGDRPGGLSVFDADKPDAGPVAQSGQELEAGYIVHDPSTGTLYVVDEHKAAGRGDPLPGIHAFGFDAATGALAWLDSVDVHAPFPTFLDILPSSRQLVCATHGSFDQVQRVVRTGQGWRTEFVQDSSTVSLWRLGADGRFGGLLDIAVLTGQGPDPNGSPQAAGHAQAGPHAHCAVVDPTGRFVIVCDKGTDTIHVYRLEAERLRPLSGYRFPDATAPRHAAFSADGRQVYVTLEIGNGVAAMAFDPATAALSIHARVPATGPGHEGLNEPAEIRLHPGGSTVYANNRGEDALAWFRSTDMARLGAVPLAPSLHPGLAARSFALTPDGSRLILADRPADLLRLYDIDLATGALSPAETIPVSAPVFVALVKKDGQDR